MATTVAEMIAWLQTLPPDAEVECGYESSGAYSTYMSYGPVDTRYSDVYNYRDDPHYIGTKMEGRIIVRIESTEG